MTLVGRSESESLSSAHDVGSVWESWCSGGSNAWGGKLFNKAERSCRCAFSDATGRVVYRGGIKAKRFAIMLICDDVDVMEMMSGIHDDNTCRCTRGSRPDNSESDLRGIR